MKFLERLERAIEEMLGRLQKRGSGQEPLEITSAIQNEVETKITPIGNGKRVFPFNHLKVDLYAADDERSALYKVAFVDGERLKNAIVQRLGPPRCESPKRLSIEINIVSKTDQEPTDKAFNISYLYHQDDKGTSETGARLIVLRGEARTRVFKIEKQEVRIGRQSEVLNKDGLPVRRNDLIFLDNENEINQSVSRRQAHLKVDRATGQFKVYDDDSAYGTVVIRADRDPLKVTRNFGVALQSGDEIYFGQACVKFEKSE